MCVLFLGECECIVKIFAGCRELVVEAVVVLCRLWEALAALKGHDFLETKNFTSSLKPA